MTSLEALVVRPLKGIGPISLGDSKADCIAKLGSDFREIKRWTFSNKVTMGFADQSIHITIDEHETVVGIVIGRPRHVLLENVQLLGTLLSDVAEKLAVAGVTTEIIDVGLFCPKEGIALVEAEGVVGGVEMCAPRS